MLTMRFEKIIEGRFEFSQNKTRKPHSILLNDNVIWIIKDYIDKDFTIRLHSFRRGYSLLQCALQLHRKES